MLRDSVISYLPICLSNPFSAHANYCDLSGLKESCFGFATWWSGHTFPKVQPIDFFERYRKAD
jgi:hypothetical protein